jgi:hypothetical protein
MDRSKISEHIELINNSIPAVHPCGLRGAMVSRKFSMFGEAKGGRRKK